MPPATRLNGWKLLTAGARVGITRMEISAPWIASFPVKLVSRAFASALFGTMTRSFVSLKVRGTPVRLDHLAMDAILKFDLIAEFVRPAAIECDLQRRRRSKYSEVRGRERWRRRRMLRSTCPLGG